jgi:hypothetical protein
MVNSEENNLFSNNLIENTLLGECVLNNLENILKNFIPVVNVQKNENSDNEENSLKNNLIEGTFGIQYKPLGSKRVKLVELVYYLLTYFKNVQSVLDKILVKSEFLKYMIEYFFIHEWNNMYQLNFENLLKSYINNINNHPEITRYLFDELKLLNIFIEKGTPCANTEDGENGFSFNSSRKINHGYFAILIELCNLISHLENFNSVFKNNYCTEEWTIFVKEKVVYWKKLFDRKLCVPETPANISHEDTGISHVSSGHIGNEGGEGNDGDKNMYSYANENEGDNKEEHNPFQRDDYFMNMGQETDDWFNPKKHEGGDFSAEQLLEDINSFEFIDENRGGHHLGHPGRKKSTEEMIMEEQE